jgi:hypothetical protein
MEGTKRMVVLDPGGCGEAVVVGIHKDEQARMIAGEKQENGRRWWWFIAATWREHNDVVLVVRRRQQRMGGALVSDREEKESDAVDWKV